MKRTSRRLTLRRETLDVIGVEELADAVVVAAAENGDTTFNCPTDICIILPTSVRTPCYTTPLYQTCWACG